MGFVTYHLISGGAFFTGAGMILLAAIIPRIPEKPRIDMFARLLAIFGFILLVFSSTPLSFFYYAALVTLLAAWLAVNHSAAAKRRKPRIAVSAALALCCISGVVLEAPHHLLPRIKGEIFRDIYLIGDSISAGIDERDLTWPEIIRDREGIPIIDLSRAGETLSTALSQGEKIEPDRAMVLLEIGGNDLLGEETAGEFEKGMDALLGAVSGPERKVVMLELPLPPFHNAYGRVQRKLARRHGVILVPKRFFAKVLAAPGATSDGLHLSEKGAALMANTMAKLIGSSVYFQ